MHAMQAFIPHAPLRLQKPVHRWTCQSTPPARPPKPSATASRAALLDLLKAASLTAPTPAQAQSIEECIQELLTFRGDAPRADDLTDEEGDWAPRLNGRWRLAFSTETPLQAVLKTFSSALEAGGVYQILEDGNLQNIISGGSLALVVDGIYNPTIENGIRACPFTFRGTRLLSGNAVKRFSGQGDEPGGLDVRVGFALGKGCFKVLWLDHLLRVERDTTVGDWLNVYLYQGPARKCSAR